MNGYKPRATHKVIVYLQYTSTLEMTSACRHFGFLPSNVWSKSNVTYCIVIPENVSFALQAYWAFLFLSKYPHLWCSSDSGSNWLTAVFQFFSYLCQWCVFTTGPQCCSKPAVFRMAGPCVHLVVMECWMTVIGQPNDRSHRNKHSNSNKNLNKTIIRHSFCCPPLQTACAAI